MRPKWLNLKVTDFSITVVIRCPPWAHLGNNFFFQGAITNILEENVVQPLLVSTSAITLASETVRSILKIDDIVSYVGDIMFRGGCFCL
jgi:hypothetical protein